MPTTAEQNRKKRENKKIRRNTLLRSQYPVIEEWGLVEYNHTCLSGKIIHDPRFVDGIPVVTTGKIVWVDHLLAKTEQNTYVLGTPSVDYLRRISRVPARPDMGECHG
eukprot:2658251-Prymnesium_polylepis.1